MFLNGKKNAYKVGAFIKSHAGVKVVASGRFVTVKVGKARAFCQIVPDESLPVRFIKKDEFLSVPAGVERVQVKKGAVARWALRGALELLPC